MAKWNVDPSHTTIGFSVRHMMITNVRGEFQKVSGTAELDPKSPAGGKITGTVEVASIQTREEKRDAHLRSADFFDAEKHPTLTFTSSEITKKGSGYEAKGTITIRGITKPLVIQVDEVTGEGKDPWGQTRIGVHAHASLKRSDFGLTWNQALEAGGVLVGDEVKLSFELSLVQASVAKEAGADTLTA
jgi:polyisoprenoid-binding protein YceI